jgi:hypothetical protein
MFNRELHRRLEGEEEREIRVRVLDSFYRRLQNVLEARGWQEEEGLREILAAGLVALDETEPAKKQLGDMTPEEKLRFLQNRASSLEAGYATLKFQAYQVMNQNDALEMNMKGLMPRLEGATARVEALEEEVRRLRALVPESERQGDVLVLEPPAEPEHRTLGERIRALFAR